MDDGRGSGHNVSKFVTITVNKLITNETNALPVADAGDDQPNVPINSTVTLDGSGSTDSDGYIAEYNWTKVSGPSATLNDSTYVKPTFYADKVGTYIWKLGVMDNKSAWSATEDEVTITVIKNRAPIIDISSPIEMTIYNTTDVVFFNSTGTYDPDGDFNGNGMIDGSEQDNLTYSWAIRKGNETPFFQSNAAIFNSSSMIT